MAFNEDEVILFDGESGNIHAEWVTQLFDLDTNQWSGIFLYYQGLKSGKHRFLLIDGEDKELFNLLGSDYGTTMTACLREYERIYHARTAEAEREQTEAGDNGLY